MARSRNRKRKPYYSPSAGTFRPKERKEEPPSSPAEGHGSSNPPNEEDTTINNGMEPPLRTDGTCSPLSMARELKEEGNRRFQRKDYAGAMEQYDHALKLTPHNHPDRAVYHSNKAACLMQLKPVQFDAVIRECSSALEVHPGFGRALLRRARAYEAVGKLESALHDVQLLLQGDNNHQDALDLVKRLRISLGAGEAAQRDTQGRPPTPVPSSHDRIDVEASAVTEGSPGSYLSDHLQNKGDFLAAKPGLVTENCSPSPFPTLDSSQIENVPSSGIAANSAHNTLQQQEQVQRSMFEAAGPLHLRPLKLIYDHDIRLAELSADGKFGDLRNLVKEKFPSSKAVLIKYKDMEGDLVTITNTKELRLAETAATVQAARKRIQAASNLASQDSNTHTEQCKPAIGLPIRPASLDPLRLHVVEVPAEQEPFPEEDEALKNGNLEKMDHNRASKESVPRSGANAAEGGPLEGKEIELDKWLVDFAQLFRTHLGIDSDAHVDLHEMGLELCSEALEEAATTEEAHQLFEQASGKFQAIAAQAFYNWGNVYMCAARKQLPHDSDDKMADFCDRLQAAFDWAQEQYALAEEKFNQSLLVKHDFYEASVALAQKDFDRAKLSWSLAIAQQLDLTTWESSEMIELFRTAEKRMQTAAELLGKIRECRAKSLLVPEKDFEKVSSQGNANDPHEFSDAENQIHLFWGNILYEHSQVEFRLGLPSWKQLLDEALQKFEVAGVSQSEMTIAVEKHLSSSSNFLDTSTLVTEELKHDTVDASYKVPEDEQPEDKHEIDVERSKFLNMPDVAITQTISEHQGELPHDCDLTELKERDDIYASECLHRSEGETFSDSVIADACETRHVAVENGLVDISSSPRNAATVVSPVESIQSRDENLTEVQERTQILNVKDTNIDTKTMADGRELTDHVHAGEAYKDTEVTDDTMIMTTFKQENVSRDTKAERVHESCESVDGYEDELADGKKEVSEAHPDGNDSTVAGINRQEDSLLEETKVCEAYDHAEICQDNHHLMCHDTGENQPFITIPSKGLLENGLSENS